MDFRELLSERNSLDQNSAEGQADNARFSELIRVCMLDPNTRQPKFPNQADYDSQSDQTWVIEAAAELAGMIYGLDPDYDKNLEENKLRHIIKHLLNEEGRYIAYRTEEGKKNKDPEQQYFVNVDGEEVVKITNKDGEEEWVKISLKERKPFLDEDNKPIKCEESSESEEAKPKRKRKATKAT